MATRTVPDFADRDIVVMRCSSAQGVVTIWKPFAGEYVERLYATPTTDSGGTPLVVSVDFTSRGYEDPTPIALVDTSPTEI